VCPLQPEAYFKRFASSDGDPLISVAATVMQADVFDAAAAADYASNAKVYSVNASCLSDGISNAFNFVRHGGCGRGAGWRCVGGKGGLGFLLFDRVERI
jgi:hypothetical protein